MLTNALSLSHLFIHLFVSICSHFIFACLSVCLFNQFVNLLIYYRKKMRADLEQCSVLLELCELLCPTSWLGCWPCWPMSSPSEQEGQLLPCLVENDKPLESTFLSSASMSKTL